MEVIYPNAECIDVVLDNLNTHHYHSLVEFFGNQEACLSHRIPSEWVLTTEMIAWEDARNENKSKIRWNFTVEEARKVFNGCINS